MPYRSLSLGACLLLLVACGEAGSADSKPAATTDLTPPKKTGLVPPASKDSPPQAAVRKTFLAYQKALRGKKGPAAAALVAPSTLEAYQTYVVQAQNLKREALAKLDLISLINVLRLRHELTAEELAAAEGPAVFARAVEEGWTSDQAFIDAEVGRISIHGDRADVSPAKTPFSPAFYFVEHEGAWRYDLLRGQKRLGPALESMMGASKVKDPVAFAVQLVEKASSKKPFDPKHLEGPPEGMPEPPPGSEAALSPGDDDHDHDHGHEH